MTHERADDLTELELLESQKRVEIARAYVDASEGWLRRLVHKQLSEAFGPSYLLTPGLIKSSIRRAVGARLAAEPTKFPRPIDATTFNQLIELATHPNFYAPYFQSVLVTAYPNGAAEARTFLDRLRDIRNDVSHGNGCTSRQLERAVCYSNDLIDALRSYFARVGLQKMYDYPAIIRFEDNFGNVSTLEGVSEDLNGRVIDWRRKGNGDLLPGRTLVAEVVIDPSYTSSPYEVSWQLFSGERGRGTVAKIEITNRHVGEQFELRFTIVCRRDWHRHFGRDETLCLIYRVLPPDHGGGYSSQGT